MGLTADDYQSVLTPLQQALQREQAAGAAAQFAAATNILLGGRVRLLTQLWIERYGLTVRYGPLAGMAFHHHASEGCYLPKLIGYYEYPLHPTLTTLLAKGYGRVVDIGCAEGYYAVGLARLLPQAQIIASDIQPRAQQMCQQLAQQNGVAERLTVCGGFDAESLAVTLAAAEAKTLIWCDCEGYEYLLLDPLRVEPLIDCDLLVELHQIDQPVGRAQAWLKRWHSTHEVTWIESSCSPAPPIPVEIAHWKELDQLLSRWEFRGEPTPWVWLQRRL